MHFGARWLGALLLFLLLTSCAAGRSEAQANIPAAPADSTAAAGVLINEILAHTDPPQVDTVEFFNPTGAPVSIAGWWFTDDVDDPQKMTLPAAAVVPASGYWLLQLPEGGALRLSEMGESVLLTAVDGSGAPTGYSHRADFAATPNGVSAGRVLTSDGRAHFPLQKALTLGGPNAGPRVGPVILAEIMYHPAGGKPEYIELLNTSDAAVALSNPLSPGNPWKIEGVGNYALPLISLPAGGSLFVSSAAPDAFRAAYNLPDSVLVAGPFGGGLANDGERVALLAPEPPNPEDGVVPYVVVDEVDYGVEAPWPAAPNGEGPALVRTVLDGFGAEPQNWGASTLPLEGAALATPVQISVLPAAGGGRRIAWTVGHEWRIAGFTVWHAPAGQDRAAAQPVGGTLLPRGSRHQGGDYLVIDGAADANAAYTYWVEAQTTDAATLALAQVNSAPPTLVLLPVIRQ